MVTGSQHPTESLFTVHPREELHGRLPILKAVTGIYLPSEWQLHPEMVEGIYSQTGQPQIYYLHQP